MRWLLSQYWIIQVYTMLVDAYLYEDNEQHLSECKWDAIKLIFIDLVELKDVRSYFFFFFFGVSCNHFCVNQCMACVSLYTYLVTKVVCTPHSNLLYWKHRKTEYNGEPSSSPYAIKYSQYSNLSKLYSVYVFEKSLWQSQVKLCVAIIIDTLCFNLKIHMHRPMY